MCIAALVLLDIVVHQGKGGREGLGGIVYLLVEVN